MIFLISHVTVTTASVVLWPTLFDSVTWLIKKLKFFISRSSQRYYNFNMCPFCTDFKKVVYFESIIELLKVELAFSSLL